MPNQGTGQTEKENRQAVGSANRYEELLAQAREIMNDPEFMEEVVALARLKSKLAQEMEGMVGDKSIMGQALWSLLMRGGE
ncbi:MAG: hypothetical protein B1H03_05695 [Planctomycetales bacterium 4484_113]|nr:MAG: hypothetical protein B1H03_05695 [Planctomycetales bacterium 4484_113]